MIYNVRGGVIRWQIHDFLSDDNSNICSISHRLRDIRKQEKCQNFDLENEGRCKGVEKRDLRFFQNLATWEHTFTQKDKHIYTYIHTYTYRERERQE